MKHSLWALKHWLAHRLHRNTIVLRDGSAHCTGCDWSESLALPAGLSWGDMTNSVSLEDMLECWERVGALNDPQRLENRLKQQIVHVVGKSALCSGHLAQVLECAIGSLGESAQFVDALVELLNTHVIEYGDDPQGCSECHRARALQIRRGVGDESTVMGDERGEDSAAQ